MVIGYVVDGEARAYPTALLHRHETLGAWRAEHPETVVLLGDASEYGEG